MNHPNGPILAGKEVTTALFWPREEPWTWVLRQSLAGGGAVQAEMKYWDEIQSTKTMHAVKAEVYMLFGKARIIIQL